MPRTLIIITLVLGVAGTALGETIDRVAIAPELGVDALTRDVARKHLDRELFSNPYASVVLASIDIYDEFPYLEARYFQVISDPGWNRLLAGETGGGMIAFTGEGTPFGVISEPRGLAQGHGNRIYLSDTGNNRTGTLFLECLQLRQIRKRRRFQVINVGSSIDYASLDKIVKEILRF